MSAEHALNTIRDTVHLQKTLSDNLAGPGWWIDTQLVDVDSALREEAGELASSAGYKEWWNKEDKGAADMDLDNVEVEVVDIYHFLLQAEIGDMIRFTLEEGKIEDSETQAELEQRAVARVVDRIHSSYVSYLESSDIEPIDYVIPAIHSFMGHFLIRRETESLTYLVKFWEMCFQCGLSFDVLHRLYLAKNVLNTFRRQNGYKTGEYVKVWADGNEDNYHLRKWVRSLNSEDTYDTGVVLNWLEHTYAFMKHPSKATS